MSHWVPVISLLISLAALGVAIWVQKHQHGLQERMVALEEAREKDRLAAKGKAILTAQLTSHVIPGRRHGDIESHSLRVDNTGPAEARDVTVMLDGTPVMEHAAVSSPPVQRLNRQEIRMVGPGSHFQYVLALHGNLHPPFHVDITWSDDSGEPGHYETTLSF